MVITLKYSVALTLSISLFAFNTALSAGPVNTVNDGRVVNGGTYYNTSGGKTTFTNSGSGGLWVRNNTNIRGLEVDAAGNPNNNGGTLHFYAPNSVVRVDGQIDVSGLRNGSGAYLGNGGKVFVDSAYYYQSGQIFANGVNGGLVQMNVGAATMQVGSSIQAKGFGGNGGVISINADGPVQIKPNTLLDSSGKVAGNFDTNLINIEGSVVRAAGVMNASGAVVSTAEGSRGGTVRLVATGNSNLNQLNQALQDATTPGTVTGQMAPTFSTNERNTLATELQDTVNQYDGDVHISGTFDRNNNNRVIPAIINVNGTSGAVAGNNDTTVNNTARAGDGGTVILNAMSDVQNLGIIRANGGNGASSGSPIQGGNGGTIAVTAGERINNDLFTYTTRNNGLVGQLEASGGAGGKATGILNPVAGAIGGTGGLMAFSYKTGMVNKGDIAARGGQGGAGANTITQFISAGGNGGKGGLIVLSGPNNPTNGGALKADGGNGGQGSNVNASQAQGGSAGTVVVPNPQTLAQSQNASQKMGNPGLNQSTSRGTGSTVAINQQTAENELLSHNENLILLTRNVTNGSRFVNLNDRAENAVMRSVSNPQNTTAVSNEIAAKEANTGNGSYRNFVIGSNANQLGLNLTSNPVFTLGNGSEVNLFRLNTLTVANDGPLTNLNTWTVGNTQSLGGGRVSLLAGGNIQNGSGFSTAGGASGGSINMASRGKIDNFEVLSTHASDNTNNIHGGSLMLNARGDITNYGYRLIGTNGQMIGGTQRFNTNRNFLNIGDLQAQAQSTESNMPTHGGNIQVRASGNIQNGNDSFSPVFVYASALGGNAGRGGNIRMQGQSVDNNFADVNVNGSAQAGKFTVAP